MYCKQMAANCFMHSSTILKSECSGSIIKEEEIKNKELIKYLTDIRLTYSQHNTSICESHIKEPKTRLYNRQRSTICGMPEQISSHIGEKHRKERIITAVQSLKIKDLYGMVIPIGIDINFTSLGTKSTRGNSPTDLKTVH